MRILFALLFVAGPALASDADLLRCRELPDGPGRLACYNAIQVGRAPAPAPVAVAAAKPQQPDKVTTSIAGVFDGWVPGQKIRLANGDVWKVVDGSEDIVELRDPKVTVERGLLGAIFLDIEGANRSPKVQRVK